jgi:hypothetical protein
MAIWKAAFQITPIILSGGIAGFMPAEMLPLVAVTEAINTPLGIISGSSQSDLDNFFASFAPLSGGTLIEQDIARYPFANQTVAANAVIGQPLRIAMLMICPARNRFGYFEKLAVITALQAVLRLHNNAGGTYMVATPSFIYTNCILRRMSDVSSGLSKQPQSAWLLEFEQPLITISDAQSAQSSLMKQLSNLTQVNGPPSWSGPAATIPSASFAGPSANPGISAQGLPGSITTTPLPPL